MIKMGFSKLFAKDFKNQYLQKLRSLYVDKTFTDVRLVSEDLKHYFAHQVILASASPVLRNILQGLSNVQFPVIYCKDVKGEDLNSVLEFIYNGELKSEQNYTKVLQLLKDFKLDEVFEIEDVEEESQPDEVIKQEKHLKCDIDTTKITDTTDTKNLKVKTERGAREKKTKSLKCEDCGYISTKQSSLKSHIAVKHLNLRSSYTCHQCGDILGSKPALKLHIQARHENVRYHCDYENCEFSSSSKQATKIHKEAKHYGITYMCDQCDHKTFKKALLKKHYIVAHSDTELQCDACHFKTKSKTNLKFHIQIEHDGVRHECEECGFKARRREILKNHIKSLHSNTVHKEAKSLCSQRQGEILLNT